MGGGGQGSLPFLASLQEAYVLKGGPVRGTTRLRLLSKPHHQKRRRLAIKLQIEYLLFSKSDGREIIQPYVTFELYLWPENEPR